MRIVSYLAQVNKNGGHVHGLSPSQEEEKHRERIAQEEAKRRKEEEKKEMLKK